MTRPARDVEVDGLRALALLPVVAVNWVGYASLPNGGPLGPPQPADSPAALAALWLMATLLTGKGVALLSFLFGYGQGLSRLARGSAALPHRRRRVRRLMLLGLLHGMLIYCGDILFTYALCGWVMLGWATLPLRRLLRRLVLLTSLDLMLNFAILWFFGVGDGAGLITPTGASLAAPSTPVAWVGLNGRSFLESAFGTALLGWPPFLALMTAGLIAARLRLFTHRRWRAGLARLARRWWLPVLLLNLLWGWHYFALLQGDPLRSFFSLDFYLYVAVPLWLVLLPSLIAARTWLQRLAALGPHSLSLYLGSSVLSLVLFSGIGLHLQLGTAPTFGLALAYWGLALWWAQRWRGRLPLESWLARA